MRAILAFALMIQPTGPAFAETCGMSHAFNYPDDRGHKQVSVWRDSQAALAFADALHVNTDGSSRSYKVEDFWGEKDAINNLCNAMSDACAGLKTEAQQRERREATQKARLAGWPKDQLAATRIAPDIIPMRDGKPCPEVDGFLVSATALQNPDVADRCSLKRYSDTAVVPGLVLPGRGNQKKVPTLFEKAHAGVGDLMIAYYPARDALVYGVVNDLGPRNELGEVSVALAGTLLGKTAPPANYMEVRGKKGFAGKGWDVPKSFILVFPNTRDADKPYTTVDRIEAAAKARLAAWGGVARLKACAGAYLNQ